VNGRYGRATTPDERIAIATVAAIHAYFVQHPQETAPGQSFLEEYLKPFVERERLEAQLEERHRHVKEVAQREREIAELLGAAIRRCVKLVGPQKHHD
jgi:hypothetical protein